jgi:SAM-dependent methyltransferase
MSVSVSVSVSRFCETVVTQFGRPTGILGAVAGAIMAHRPSNRKRAYQTLELLEIAPADRILEIGFGPGVAIERASRLAPAGVIFGIDHSEVMLQQARRRNARAIEEGRVILQLAAVEELPSFSQPFDEIFAINSVAFWDEPLTRLSELRDLLAPDGRLAITVQPRGRNASAETARRYAERLGAWLKEAALRDVRVELLPLKPVPAACAIGNR